MSYRRTPLPASFFSMAVGVLALSNAWRVATPLWHLPPAIAQGVSWAGIAIWLVLLALYAHKWVAARAEARAETAHPVQSSFVALGPIASMLAAIALLSISRPVALIVFELSVAAQVAVGVWLSGRLWQGNGKAELLTPAAYLPGVGQNFVAATASAAFGWPHLGVLFFGAGVFSWVAIESMILGRAAFREPLPEALRPTLGVQLAPPVVGGVAWMSVNGGAPDLFAQVLLGYGLFQGAMLLRLLPWTVKQGFVPGYWSYSFGVAAMPTLAMRLLAAGGAGPVEWLAPVLFVAANIVIGLLAVMTAGQLLAGRLLPVTAAPPA